MLLRSRRLGTTISIPIVRQALRHAPDVTLNHLARRYALEGMKRYGLPEMRSAISCCIGRRDIRVSLFDRDMKLVETRVESEPASHVIETLGLNKCGYARRCALGMFGHEGWL